MIGATNPLQATHRLDPRRLRDRGRPEHGPRVGFAPSRRPARSRCSSPSWAERGTAAMGAADPRLALAPAPGDPRAARDRVQVRSRRRGARGGPAARGGGRERLPQGRGRSPRPDAEQPVLGVDTVVCIGVADLYGKPGRRGGCARRRCARSAGRRHTVISGLCLIEDGRTADRGREHRGRVPAAGRRAARLVPRQRRVARTRRRLRDPGPRRGARGGDRGRLPQRRRAAGGDAARAGARAADGAAA